MKSYKDYEICGTDKTVEEAIELTQKTQPNLVFLNIVLGTKTGFDYLNVFFPDIDFEVIFTTGYNKYAAKAFEFSALNFLIKPINDNLFEQALERVGEKISIQERLKMLKN